MSRRIQKTGSHRITIPEIALEVSLIYASKIAEKLSSSFSANKITFFYILVSWLKSFSK